MGYDPGEPWSLASLEEKFLEVNQLCELNKAVAVCQQEEVSMPPLFKSFDVKQYVIPILHCELG